ncbi:MAG: hypothetical protein Q7K34_00915 [archaeon]|nr:hypothetical protein [archaeon]
MIFGFGSRLLRKRAAIKSEVDSQQKKLERLRKKHLAAVAKAEQASRKFGGIRAPKAMGKIASSKEKASFIAAAIAAKGAKIQQLRLQSGQLRRTPAFENAVRQKQGRKRSRRQVVERLKQKIRNTFSADARQRRKQRKLTLKQLRQELRTLQQQSKKYAGYPTTSRELARHILRLDPPYIALKSAANPLWEEIRKENLALNRAQGRLTELTSTPQERRLPSHGNEVRRAQLAIEYAQLSLDERKSRFENNRNERKRRIEQIRTRVVPVTLRRMRELRERINEVADLIRQA